MSQYEYSGTMIRVIDGDTVVLRLQKQFSQEIDVGFYIKQTVHADVMTEQSFRLNGINTPEVVGAEKSAGVAAKTALTSLLQGHVLRVITYKDDKYGRWLCDVYAKQQDGSEVFVNQWLVEHGFAKPYDGKGPKP